MTMKAIKLNNSNNGYNYYNNNNIPYKHKNEFLFFVTITQKVQEVFFT